jgi:hypothetical protein
LIPWWWLVRPWLCWRMSMDQKVGIQLSHWGRHLSLTWSHQRHQVTCNWIPKKRLMVGTKIKWQGRRRTKI